jgi:hypothetical protein
LSYSTISSFTNNKGKSSKLKEEWKRWGVGYFYRT